MPTYTLPNGRKVISQESLDDNDLRDAYEQSKNIPQGPEKELSEGEDIAQKALTGTQFAGGFLPGFLSTPVTGLTEYGIQRIRGKESDEAIKEAGKAAAIDAAITAGTLALPVVGGIAKGAAKPIIKTLAKEGVDFGTREGIEILMKKLTQNASEKLAGKLTVADKKLMQNMSVGDIKNILYPARKQGWQNIVSKVGQESLGLEDDLTRHAMKRAEQGKKLSFNPYKADDPLENISTVAIPKAQEQARLLKKVMSNEYEKAWASVPESVKKSKVDVTDIHDAIKSYGDKDTTALLKKFGLNKKSYSVDDLVKLRNKLSDSPSMRKVYQNRAYNDPSIMLTDKDMAISDMTKLVREKLNSIDAIKNANKIYGESIEPANKVLHLTRDKGIKRFVMALNKPDVNIKTVIEPLENFQAALIKHSDKGTTPVVDELFDEIVRAKGSTWRGGGGIPLPFVSGAKFIKPSPFLWAASRVPTGKAAIQKTGKTYAFAKRRQEEEE